MTGVLKFTEDGTNWQELLAGPKGDQGPKGADSTVPGPEGPAGPPGAPGDLTQAAADTRYVNTAGDTMTGPLVTTAITADSLGGNAADTILTSHLNASGRTVWGLANPTGADWAATKGYVDSKSGWETVAALANLPGSGNWPGRQIQVTGGLGLQVMVWSGTWRVDPVSDTGLRTLLTGFAPGIIAHSGLEIRRTGNTITGEIGIESPAGWVSGTAIYTLPTGWTPTYEVYRGESYTGQVPSWAIFPGGPIAAFKGGVFLLRAPLLWTTTEPWPTAAPWNR